MNEKSGWQNKVVYGVAAVLCLVFFLFSFQQDRPYLQQDVDTMPRKIEFKGSYQIDGQASADLKAGQIQAEDPGEEVILRGHFNQTIEEDTMLYFRIYHIGVRMYLNGAEVFSYGQRGGQSEIYHALGDLWDGFKVEKRISPDDTVEFHLTDPVEAGRYRTVTEYNFFLDNIYAGSWGQMIRAVLIDNWPHLLLSVFLITNGTALWIMAMALKYTKADVDQIVFNGAYLFVVMGLWMLTSGRILSLITSYNGVIMSVEYVLLFLMGALIFRYIGTIIESRARLFIRFLEYSSVLLLVLYMFLQAFGIMDGFEFQVKAIIPMMIMLVSAIVCLVNEHFRYRRAGVSYMAVSVIILVVFYLIGVSEFLLRMPQRDTWYDIGIFIFTLMQLVFIIHYLRRKLLEAKQAETVKVELAETKMRMMISQIRPHFIFNTLNAISALCLEDPLAADEAIVKFSKYLRANIAVLEGPRYISFEEELGHIKNYVAIEQMRFRGKINVDYDIGFSGFSVPLLSIQPIVENAIKHGISRQKNGGTVTVQSRREADCAVVTVEDDGVGFDPRTFNEKKESVGMRNIDARLRISSKAVVKVESEPGKGTRVTVQIPIENTGWSAAQEDKK